MIRKLLFDSVKTVSKCCIVQLGEVTHNSKCKRDLDSVPQLRHGAQLNTSRRARAACGVVGTRIASTLRNQGGDFLLSHSSKRRAKTPLNRRARRLQKSAACHSALFSRASFTRFRVREVTGNSWQAVYGRSTMACYPPHVSKVASYPTELVGNAALREQGKAEWHDAKPQCSWDESVLRIREQVLISTSHSLFFFSPCPCGSTVAVNSPIL